jgi:hypothetical protein
VRDDRKTTIRITLHGYQIKSLSIILFTRRYWGYPFWFLFLRLLICLNSPGNHTRKKVHLLRRGVGEKSIPTQREVPDTTGYAYSGGRPRTRDYPGSSGCPRRNGSQLGATPGPLGKGTPRLRVAPLPIPGGIGRIRGRRATVLALPICDRPRESSLAGRSPRGPGTVPAEPTRHSSVLRDAFSSMLPRGEHETPRKRYLRSKYLRFTRQCNSPVNYRN